MSCRLHQGPVCLGQWENSPAGAVPQLLPSARVEKIGQ